MTPVIYSNKKRSAGFAKLEVRRGNVEPIGVRTDVSGTENTVSSATVTTFELDGAVTEFSGGTLPFRVGDEAIVAGRLASSGIFVAYAVALPRQRLLLDRYSPTLVAFGGVFAAAGVGIGIGVIPDAMNWLPEVGPLILTSVVSLVFTGAGLGIVWAALVARQAKIMVQQANDQDRSKRL